MRKLLIIGLFCLTACKAEVTLVDPSETTGLFQITEADEVSYLLNTQTGETWRRVIQIDDHGGFYYTYWSPMDRLNSFQVSAAIEDLRVHNEKLKNPPKEEE